MIEINGAKFAENENEFLDSLFSDKTCVGFYKVYKRSINIYDKNKNKIGCINRHKCLLNAEPYKGKFIYSFATIKEIGEYSSYLKHSQEIEKIYNRFNLY